MITIKRINKNCFASIISSCKSMFCQWNLANSTKLLNWSWSFLSLIYVTDVPDNVSEFLPIKLCDTFGKSWAVCLYDDNTLLHVIFSDHILLPKQVLDNIHYFKYECSIVLSCNVPIVFIPRIQLYPMSF